MAASVFPLPRRAHKLLLRKSTPSSFTIVYAVGAGGAGAIRARYPFRGNFPRFSPPSRRLRRPDGGLISHQLSLTRQLSTALARLTTRVYARFHHRRRRRRRRRCSRLPGCVASRRFISRDAMRRGTTRPYFATFPLPRRIYQR